MTGKTDRQLLIPRPLRRLPADLVLIAVLTVLTDIVVFAPILDETPLRVVLGLPFVLFYPGYAFIAVLFPEAGHATVADNIAATDNGTEPERDDDRILPRDGIDGIERTALSLGLSVAISPLIGLVLNFTPFGIRLAPVALAISGFTLVMSVVAALRRWRLSAEERFQVPYRDWYTGIYTSIFKPDTRLDAVLNVVLVLSLVLAVASVGYAVAFPKQGESFTALYLLSKNESGDLVADDYPTNMTAGEKSEPLVVGVDNHEHQSMDYSLVVELQRVRFGPNNSTRVIASKQLHQFSPSIGANQTWRHRHRVTPTLTGDRLRLTYLLYQGDLPANPRMATAYREIHLWVNVSASNRTASASNRSLIRKTE